VKLTWAKGFPDSQSQRFPVAPRSFSLLHALWVPEPLCSYCFLLVQYFVVLSGHLLRSCPGWTLPVLLCWNPHSCWGLAKNTWTLLLCFSGCTTRCLVHGEDQTFIHWWIRSPLWLLCVSKQSVFTMGPERSPASPTLHPTQSLNLQLS
jgi:hypothetical protein